MFSDSIFIFIYGIYLNINENNFLIENYTIILKYKLIYIRNSYYIRIEFEFIRE